MRVPEQDILHVVERVGVSWNSLRGARLFVTGGTGFFGKWLLASLNLANQEYELGVQVCVLSREPSKFIETEPEIAAYPFVRFISGDVRTFELPLEGFTHIIHAATDTTQEADKEAHELIDTIVSGTRHVISGAVANHACRMLYLSSGAIYGNTSPDQVCISEAVSTACDPLEPTSSYGQGKRMAEHLCALAASRGELECVVARCFSCVGPLMPLDTHFAIGNFIYDALWSDCIRIRGNGMPYRSYLYMADLTAWLWLLLLEGKSGQAYNVGSSEAISIADLAGLVLEVLAPNKKLVIEGGMKAKEHRNYYIPCTEKARNEFGVDVWVPLDEAIHRTAMFALKFNDGNKVL